jgi:SAM-dependent methyltransferase
MKNCVMRNIESPIEPISEATIRQVAREHLSPSNLGLIVLKQALYEQRAKLRTRMSFRERKNDAAVKAYTAMSLEEFDGINARQRWANWRTVPRNLSRRMANRPSFAIDLCCGVGQSTEVLAHYLPRGSRILGLEYNPNFVEMARGRKYLNAQGEPVDVHFRAQSVLETFLDANGQALADDSVDLVNSCGAIGHHFDADTTRVLAIEVDRVVRPGGLALIDSGMKGTRTQDVIRIFEAHGFEVIHRARSCFADWNLQVCFRKKA